MGADACKVDSIGLFRLFGLWGSDLMGLRP